MPHFCLNGFRSISCCLLYHTRYLVKFAPQVCLPSGSSKDSMDQRMCLVILLAGWYSIAFYWTATTPTSMCYTQSLDFTFIIQSYKEKPHGKKTTNFQPTTLNCHNLLTDHAILSIHNIALCHLYWKDQKNSEWNIWQKSTKTQVK